MSFSIGLDIGGTKIAGAVYDDGNTEIKHIILLTPKEYAELVATCVVIVTQLEEIVGQKATVGIGLPGSIDRDAGVVIFAGNTPCLVGRTLRDDLENRLQRSIHIANDADCAALSEAVDGAGRGYRNVFGLILGTGVGGGIVINGQLVQGVNGLAGEFGHMALPFREASDGPVAACHCGQHGCIDKSASGPALSRLYHHMTGKPADAGQIAELARKKDSEACRVLDVFTTTLAKAMMPVIHMFDPDVIVVSGGLRDLPHIYDEVPKRFGKYALHQELKTKFVPAKYGSLSGLRGAAWLGRE